VSAALAAVLVVASCFDDAVAPALPFRGHFAVVPSFQSTASGIVPISSIRITLQRPGDPGFAVDTTLIVTAGQDSVSLALTVGMLTQSDIFVLNIAMVSPTGDTVFRGGPMTVTPSAEGEETPAISVEFRYTGVGANAASVHILTPDTSGFSGDTVAFTAEALDSADNVIPGTPIVWYTLDSAQASVPNPGTGTVVAGTVLGTARVVAQLLTNQADTALFIVRPAPSAVVLEPVSGNAQSGVVATVLPESLVVRAVDEFGNPVANQRIDFTVALGGGSLASGTMATNDSGLAYDFWTLGTLVADSQRVQTAIIDTVTTLPVAIVDFVATPLPDAPNQVGFTVQPSGAVVGDPFGADVGVLDQYGNPVTGDDTTVVSLALAANPVAGTLSGTTAATVVSGVAAFTDLSIDVVGIGYTLAASASGLAGDTSAVFNIVGPPGVVYWVNPAGGNWSNGANWSTGAMPGTADSAVIDLDGTYTVTLDVSDTVGYLNVGGTTGAQTFSMAGSTLAIDSGAVFGPTAVYALSGGTLTGPATVVIDGALDWTGGTMSDSGATEIGPGGLATVSSPGPMYLSQRTFRNFGTMTWVSGATWQLSGLSPTQFINESGATLTLAAPLTLRWATTAAGKELINNGTIVASAGATIDVLLTQNGTITVGAVTLDLSGAGSLGGTVDVAAGGNLRISNSFTVVPGFTFTGLGLVEVAVPGVAGLTIQAGDSLVLPRLVQTSGNVQGDGALTITDSLHWASGFQIGTGTTYVIDTAVAYLTTASTKELAQRTFRNFGTLIWDNGSVGLAGAGPTQLVNEAGATLTIAGARTLTFGSTPSTGKELLNNGTVLSQPGVGNQTTIDVAFTNNGTLVLDPGTTSLIGTFSHPTGALLRGNGTLDLSSATIVGGTLAGDVEPGTSPGMMTITGDFPQDAASSLNIEFAGAVAGTGYDVLNVTGAATLNGVLTVLDTVGFTPAAGLYPIMTFGTRTGAFSSVTIPTFAGLTVDTLYTSGQTPDTLYYVVVDPLGGAPPGTEAAWTGAVSSDWYTAGNWTSGAVPDDTTNAYVNGTVTPQPVASADAYADTLTLGAGATLTVNSPNTLWIRGSLDAGNTIAGTGTVAMTGTNQSLSGSVPNLQIAGTISLSGFTTVGGDLEIASGALHLNGNSLDATSGSGALIYGNTTSALDFGAADGTSSVARFNSWSEFGGPYYLSLHDDLDTLQILGNVDLYGQMPADTGITGGVIEVHGYFWEDGSPGFTVDSTGTNTLVMMQPTGDLSFKDLAVVSGVLRHVMLADSAHVSIGTTPTPITGNLTVTDNAAFTNGFDALISGDLITDANGIVQQSSGIITVGGNASFGGGSTDGLLTGGTLQVGGDFTQLATNSISSYAASAGHTTQLSGDGIVQRVSFASPDSVSGSRLGALSAVSASFNGDTLQLDTRLFVLGDVTFSDNNGDFPLVLLGSGDLTVDGAFTTTTTGAGVRVIPTAIRLRKGNPTLGVGTLFQPDTTEFFGGEIENAIPITPNYVNVVITDDTAHFLTFNSDSLSGSLIVRGRGRLNLNTNTIAVAKDLITSDLGTLMMTDSNPTLTVYGNVTFDGGSTAGLLTAGTLVAGGDFSQLATNSAESFAASATHRTEFAGNGVAGNTLQAVTFATPGTGAGFSHFGDLLLNKQSQGSVNLGSILFADGQLQTISAGDTNAIVGNGNTMEVHGLAADSLTIDGAPLIVRDGDAISYFNVVTFQNFATSDVQLEVERASGTYVFNLLRFTTTPTTGLYLNLVDGDGTATTLLSLTMSNPFPVTPGGLVQTDGIASLTW